MLESLLEQAEAAEPTYPEVGATRSDRLPDGYRHDRDERRLGGSFEAAVEAIRGWGPQRGAGIDLVPAEARVEPGATALFVIRATPFWAVAPVRVAYVVDEPDRFAYAWATLPGHPERGEASLSLERDAGGMMLRVVSFSRVDDPIARLGSPLARRLQRRVTAGYAETLAAAAR